MNIKYAISTIVLASVVAGCSHKPIPVDVIRKATRGIVHSVRCETRLAVEQALIKKWTEIGERYNHSATLALVDRVNRNELNYSEFLREVQRGGIHPAAVRALERYKTYGMAYDFEFDITENNNESLGTKFKVPVIHGSFTLDIGAGHERARKNVRTVKVDDSFEDLFEKLRDADCAENYRQAKNWDYPIAGKIGMTEVVQSFIDINDDVVGSDMAGPQGIKVFSDKVVYTTKYSAGVTPKVTLGPVTDKFHLTEGSGTFSADRTDIHRVLLAIVPPPKPKQEEKPIRVVIINQNEGATPRVVTRAPRSRAPMRASDRAKQRARYELDRLRAEQLIDRIPDE